jgi:hypothetical protein
MGDERMAETFLTAARISADLARRPEVAEHWTQESACAGMSVGGLAHHLVQQLTNTVRILAAEPRDDAPIPLLEHYERAAWVTADLDDEVNVRIREDADVDAAGGPDGLPPVIDGALADLPGLLARSADAVLIPWQGWSLTTEDYLTTRLMEMVVHSDDLAASVGVPTPEFPEEVLAPVFTLLTGVAARRHGQVAVVRALSRPQRAPEIVSAF